jgi:methylmalonyl-CoA mutase
VNKYPPPEAVDLDVRDIDNSAVREAQVRRLAGIKQKRDGRGGERALDALRAIAKWAQGQPARRGGRRGARRAARSARSRRRSRRCSRATAPR